MGHRSSKSKWPKSFDDNFKLIGLPSDFQPQGGRHTNKPGTRRAQAQSAQKNTPSFEAIYFYQKIRISWSLSFR
jgi:hypothetical protein